MPLPNTGTYTIDDIFALPEGERAELINGVIYNMTPPTRLHKLNPFVCHRRKPTTFR